MPYIRDLNLTGFLTLRLRTYLLYLPPLREWLKKAFVAIYSSGAVTDFHRLPLQIHFFYNKNSGDCQVFFNFLKIIYYKALALFLTLASLSYKRIRRKGLYSRVFCWNIERNSPN